MSVTISIIISMLALLATFYQLHLQRVHNEKSVKPLGQIDLPDQKSRIAIHIRNNGLGPLIIDRLLFSKSDTIYSSIADCLDLDPKTYMHITVKETMQRVILPDAHLIVFEKNLGDHTDETDRNRLRDQLAPISLKVHCRDIYDNKIVLERDFRWFVRHELESKSR